jgi:hypothetical protein
MELDELLDVTELTSVLWPTDDDDPVEDAEGDASLLETDDEAGVTSPVGTSQASSRRNSAPAKPEVLVELFPGNKPSPAQ